jgi:hypothetical protein
VQNFYNYLKINIIKTLTYDVDKIFLRLKHQSDKFGPSFDRALYDPASLNQFFLIQIPSGSRYTATSRFY